MDRFTEIDDSVECISAFTMRVELGKLREFARATGYLEGPLLDVDDPAILPTFLASMVFWRPPGARLPHEHLGFDEHRVLHGEEEYVFGADPIRPGDVLEVSVHVLAPEVKEGRRGGTLRIGTAITNYRRPGGELAAQARTTIIETEKAP